MNKKLRIAGLVQGVGFRPFVYKLAHRFNLHGYILNNTEGVSVEVEGKQISIQAFMLALQNELPPLARIDTLIEEIAEYVGYRSFQILQSATQNNKRTLVSPDIAICENCLQEMNDPNNRRYGYAFINCTDCGPRYSIIKTLPYDRPNTSMHFFPMCEACQNEYTNPLNRRFHAQPISCFDCGPTLRLLDTNHEVLAQGEDSIKLAAQALKNGAIVALKGLGGFHLLCDATDTKVVAKLRKRKQRSDKPFAIMFPNTKTIKESADLSSKEIVLISSKEKPIVIVPKRTPMMISDLVAPDIDRIGVFLPYTPLHTLLLKQIDFPLVATSANRSDEPIIRNSKALLEKLGLVVDLVLDHNRDILNANDDSVVQIAGDKKVTLRLARGFAPKSIKLPFKSKKKILAVGANQKNSMALVFDDTLIISPHIGDLNSLEAFEYFERTLESFQRFYDFEPEVIVYDKHPEYMTTKWAKELKVNYPNLHPIQVQHHYAHLLSTMAEFHLDEKILGFAFDGTGYGDDGTIWGAEVMIADNQHYERIFTLSPFALLGGELAIKEPRRVALSLLFEYYTLAEVDALTLPLLKTFTTEEINLLHKAWKRSINAPLNSSMGRLFDAVASFADIVQLSTFEGESGLKMEQYVDENIGKSFPFSMSGGVIILEPMIRAMAEMQEKKKQNMQNEMITMFFNTLVEMIFQIAQKYPERSLLFSGGVFQNRVLLEKIIRRCKKQKCTYYFQNKTAINDGGIALGQAWYALYNGSCISK